MESSPELRTVWFQQSLKRPERSRSGAGRPAGRPPKRSSHEPDLSSTSCICADHRLSPIIGHHILKLSKNTTAANRRNGLFPTALIRLRHLLPLPRAKDEAAQPDDIITKSRKTFLCGRGKIRGGASQRKLLYNILSIRILRCNSRNFFLRGSKRNWGGAKNKIRSAECGMRSGLIGEHPISASTTFSFNEV